MAAGLHTGRDGDLAESRRHARSQVLALARDVAPLGTRGRVGVVVPPRGAGVGSDSCARRVGGWAIGGGIAAVALCVAFDRVAPAGVAMLPVVLVPGAVVALTDASPSNIG